jgi:hypothetical protein
MLSTVNRVYQNPKSDIHSFKGKPDSTKGCGQAPSRINTGKTKIKADFYVQ